MTVETTPTYRCVHTITAETTHDFLWILWYQHERWSRENNAVELHRWKKHCRFKLERTELKEGKSEAGVLMQPLTCGSQSIIFDQKIVMWHWNRFCWLYVATFVGSKCHKLTLFNFEKIFISRTVPETAALVYSVYQLLGNWPQKTCTSILIHAFVQQAMFPAHMAWKLLFDWFLKSDLVFKIKIKCYLGYFYPITIISIRCK